jgi:hypothetical protein
MNENSIKKQKITVIILISILVIVSVVSIMWAAPKYSDPEERIDAIEYLDSKRNTVLTLAGAATASSTALTLLKDDWATPIANELAELSIYFMIILAAIVLEKYLITLSGLIFFQYIVPIVCVLMICNLIWKNMEWTRVLAFKLLAFGLALFLLVPVCVQVCQVIEDTYDTSIQAAMESAQNATEFTKPENEEEKNIFQKALSSVTDTLTAAAESVKNILNNFIEAIAIMLITSCVIPILIIVIFVWIINSLAGLNITLPQLGCVKVDTKNKVVKLTEQSEQ